MVTLCIPDANGVEEQLIGKNCGWACVNEISEKVQKSPREHEVVFRSSLNLMLTTDINIVKKNVKFF
jgi:hypothetical protein